MPPTDNRAEEPQRILSAAIERLRDDHTHGASWLARHAAAAFALAAASDGGGLAALERAGQMRLLAREVAYARPSMAVVANAVARIVSAGWPDGAVLATESDEDASAALLRVRREAERLIAQWEAAASAIARHARALLTPPIFTHSRSGTVESVLTSLARDWAEPQEEPQSVIVTQSHPGDEGVATARTLAAVGWRVTLVADSAAALMMDQARCVVLGADSVRHDGSLINKVGSYPVALAARAAGIPAGIPVYVLCESLKIAPPGWPLALEEMSQEGLALEPIPGVTARNVYFDQTPANLITAIVTERGPLGPAHIAEIAQRAEARLAALPA